MDKDAMKQLDEMSDWFGPVEDPLTFP